MRVRNTIFILSSSGPDQGTLTVSAVDGALNVPAPAVLPWESKAACARRVTLYVPVTRSVEADVTVYGTVKVGCPLMDTS
jgi:hypothetical protein